MAETIRVTILDDHQSIVDGYQFRLGNIPGVEVVATIMYGEELEPTLKEHQTDVLLLDVSVPTAQDNLNPYPILHAIPKLLQLCPNLSVLVISMYVERALIRSVMEAGASGYVLKDDATAFRDLGNVVRSVAAEGIFFSQKAHELYADYLSKNSGNEFLTGRQREALSLCAAYPAWTTANLAEKMAISNSTVRNLLAGAYVKLKVHSRTAAVIKARQMALITPELPTPS